MKKQQYMCPVTGCVTVVTNGTMTTSGDGGSTSTITPDLGVITYEPQSSDFAD